MAIEGLQKWVSYLFHNTYLFIYKFTVLQSLKPTTTLAHLQILRQYKTCLHMANRTTIFNKSARCKLKQISEIMDVFNLPLHAIFRALFFWYEVL